jgi:enoyl-CoA hydratase/carnithine racemase
MSEIILSQKINSLGIITLNSPKTLNALNTSMIEALHSLLKQWREDDEVKCIFLQGGEKAFCAGGDVKQLHDTLKKNNTNESQSPKLSNLGPDLASAPETKLNPDCLDFFIKEYQLDYAIHRYPKPIVVWGDGVVMGGGIGIMVGASHRVVTEKSKLAMPEISIGLYPDVGGSYFLNKMPKGWGEYLGLTGARLSAGDALFLGLADYFITSDLKNQILEKLIAGPWSDDHKKNKSFIANTLALKKMSSSSAPPQSEAFKHNHLISEMAEAKSVEEFSAKITKLADHHEWLQPSVKIFKTGSPSSAAIIFEQLKRTKNMSLEDTFRSELNLSLQCTLHPDFAEGVRALLVDKDQNPKWYPSSFKDITSAWVTSYFTPLWSDREHPLARLGP